MGRRSNREKPKRPTTYREWAILRIAQRISKKTGKEIACSTRRLTNAPKYIFDLEKKEQRQEAAERELRGLRDEGLFVCTDGVWWNRLEKRIALPELAVQRASLTSRVCSRGPAKRKVLVKHTPAPDAKRSRAHLRVVK